MNSPIRYYGGKGTMFNNIIQYFPKPEEYDIYIEPFGGSYSIGLKKEPAMVEIYNDLDKNVYSLYKVLSNEEMFNTFKERCDLILYSDDIRKEYREKLRGDLSIEDRAFYFFYVNRTSHNGIGGFSMNSSIRRNMSKAVSDFLSCIDRLPELHERLSRVIVSNTNGNELIRKYNNKRNLIYCDPPYEQSTRTGARYSVDMNREGHIDFINAVIDNESKIIISGYDCELYDELTKNGFEKIQFEVKTIDGNFNKKTKVETLWRNFTNV